MRRTKIKPISNKQQRLMNFRMLMKPIVFESQGKRCKDCGTSTPDFRGWELSHTKSLAQGGEDTLENLMVLCAPCHAIRHGLKEV